MSRGGRLILNFRRHIVCGSDVSRDAVCGRNCHGTPPLVPAGRSGTTIERRKTVVIAQAFAEYSGGSVITSALRDLWLTMQYHLSSMSSSTWLIVGACVGLISYFWLRSS